MIVWKTHRGRHQVQIWFQNHLKTAFLVNTKHLHSICTMLDQRRGRWADVVKMFCKCFVLAAGLLVLMGLYSLNQFNTLFNCLKTGKKIYADQ